MGYRRVETYTSPGTKGSWNLELTNAQASVNITLTGTASYKLQYTLDPLDDPLATDADASWLDSNDIPAGTSTSAVCTFMTPAARIRLVIAALSGSLKMEMLQDTMPTKVLP
jgi:hypothetical protein